MSYLNPILGGILIGTALGFLSLSTRRVVGVSGVFFNLFLGPSSDRRWRLFFILGLIGAGTYFWLGQDAELPQKYQPIWRVLLSGFLVGFGTKLANGCTSGHGVCGMARFSKRSVAATVVFIGVAMLTVFCEARRWFI